MSKDSRAEAKAAEAQADAHPQSAHCTLPADSRRRLPQAAGPKAAATSLLFIACHATHHPLDLPFSCPLEQFMLRSTATTPAFVTVTTPASVSDSTSAPRNMGEEIDACPAESTSPPSWQKDTLVHIPGELIRECRSDGDLRTTDTTQRTATCSSDCPHVAATCYDIATSSDCHQEGKGFSCPQNNVQHQALYTYEDDNNDLTLAASGGPKLQRQVGEDVPDARKCACASHVATIADFFQREEEIRKEEERKKAAEERQRFEEERMELERKEQENREMRYRERERQIEEHRKKMQEEEEARERLRNHTTIASEPSIEDLNLDKKESEVEEAKAIIAQRSGNPREFFKQKERAMTISVDTSPVSIHRTGRLDSPFLKQPHSPSSSSTSTPPRGVSPLRTPPHARKQPPAAAVSIERNMAAVSPIPKIVTTPIKEDFSREEEDHGEEECDSALKEEQNRPVQESTATKPVQSVAPQAREPSGVSAWDSGTDNLVDLWDSSSTPAIDPALSTHSSNLVDLMGDGDVLYDNVPPNAAAGSGRPQPLLSFDEMMDGSFCSGTGAEDNPTSLVDVTGSDQITLSYQHALQHASGEGQDLDDGQLLMTNGETMLKEGTQASEGYFSQSQEEEFGQSEESSAKPAPVFYNKPPEIDITCWDTDPVVDDEDD
ncbi:hypothetical protein CRENBAI_023482 [Crenichthys baileyi]|uniref:Drebrin n=1 Tax=Crenichthys baileyi TaxID=28760 RepID=A0AAV9SNI2_9TELE